ASTWASLLCTTGIILSVVYALTLYRKVIFGRLTNPALFGISDLDVREWAVFIPLAAATLVLGFQPDLIFHVTSASIGSLSHGFLTAAGR
ncbi:MAG: NADH-quinone oxidoreductase subunit M, partial [Caulobacteraceae bacterium]